MSISLGSLLCALVTFGSVSDHSSPFISWSVAAKDIPAHLADAAFWTLCWLFSLAPLAGILALSPRLARSGSSRVFRLTLIGIGGGLTLCLIVGHALVAYGSDTILGGPWAVGDALASFGPLVLVLAMIAFIWKARAENAAAAAPSKTVAPPAAPRVFRTMNTPTKRETVLLTTCLTRKETVPLLLRAPDGPSFRFNIGGPDCYPDANSAWVRIELYRDLLPEAIHGLDSASYYEIGPGLLRRAVDVQVVPREELVAEAIRRLDDPRKVHRFPFGPVSTDETWRHAISAGEETNPIWVEALQKAPRPRPRRFLSRADPVKPAALQQSLTIRRPGLAPRPVSNQEVLRVQQQTQLVRWEILQAPRLIAYQIIDQDWIFPPKHDLHGIPIEYLFLHLGEEPFPEAELRQGILLMLYLYHMAAVEKVDAGAGARDHDRDHKIVELLKYVPAADSTTRELIKCVIRTIGAYDKPTLTTNYTGRLSIVDEQTRHLLKKEQEWIIENIVLNFFRRYAPPQGKPPA